MGPQMAGRKGAEAGHDAAPQQQQQQPRPSLKVRLLSLIPRLRKRQLKLQSEKRLILAKRRSQLIDRQLYDDWEQRRSEPRVLFLGPGGGGKRPFILSSLALYGGPDVVEPTPEQRAAWRIEVRSQLIRGTALTLEALMEEGLLMSEPSSYDHAKVISGKSEKGVEQELTDEIRLAILALLSDSKFRRFSKSSGQQHRCPGDLYLFKHAQRILEPDYVPTGMDVFAARFTPCGFLETFIYFDKSRIGLLELGGASNERRKWVHMLEHWTDAIIFPVDITTCDESFDDDQSSGISRMQEALVLFESIICSRWFRHIPIILLFTNVATLTDHPPSVDRLRQFFPTYVGSSSEDVINYFRNRFFAMNQEANRTMRHFCCDFFETETCVREILEEVQSITDKSRAKNTGL